MSRLEVRELTPLVLQEWLAFFDREAFADNREWAGCYCYFYHADHAAKEWSERTAAENRAAAIDLITSGRMKGYLAYVDRRPVGWCHAAPRVLLPNIASDDSLAVSDATVVGSIVCFVVARAYRRQGVARGLLDAACAGFRATGLRIAEGYPRRQAEGDAANYHGPLSLYLEAGFARYRELERVIVVRRPLPPESSR